MNPFGSIARLYRMHRAIQQGNTGCPIEFAKQFSVSRSHLYNILNELEDYGAVIRYSRKKQTFYYVETFEIPIDSLLSLSKVEIAEIFKE
jgi:predicted DNA-binding transcriptional regulator YafY